MEHNISLAELGRGRSAVVREVTVSGEMRRRLQDIGITEGSVIKAVVRSPLGDPTAYLIRGAVVALREGDSSGVLVEPLV